MGRGTDVIDSAKNRITKAGTKKKLDKPSVGGNLGFNHDLSQEKLKEQLSIEETSQKETDDFTEELDNLSEYSSEVDHSILPPSKRLLTVEEFSKLPEEGDIDPLRLRTAQGGINPEFRLGQSFSEMKKELVSSPDYTNKVPSIEIGVFKGKVYSFDTRRLIVHQQAKEENPNVRIRYKKIGGEYLKERVQSIFSSRPWNGIVTALRYDGKNSESNAYINPNYKDQLENKVQASFRPYPSERGTGVDANGFPIRLKKAKKIYSFWVEKQKAGSEYADDVVKRAKEICSTEGQEACEDFLVQSKKPQSRM